MPPSVVSLHGAEQFRDYIWLLQSVANMDPDFDLDAYRSGVARDQWDMLSDCAPADPEAAKKTLDQLDPDDLRPRDASAAAGLRRRLAAAGVPSGDPMPGSAPVLVAFGSLDVTSPPDGIQRALAAAVPRRAHRGVERPGSSEASNDQVVESALGWLYARFAGERLGNVCVGIA